MFFAVCGVLMQEFGVVETYIHMAPGVWQKIKNFFGKVWDGAKKVYKKVSPVIRKVLPVVSPFIQTTVPGGGTITKGIEKGLQFGDMLLGSNQAVGPRLKAPPVLDSPRIRLANGR